MDRKLPPTRVPFSPPKSGAAPGSEGKADKQSAPLATLRAGLAAGEQAVQPLVGLAGKAGGGKRKREDEAGEALPGPSESVLSGALAATAGQDMAQARNAWLDRMTQLGGTVMPPASRASALQALQQAAGMESITAEALAGMCEAICQALGGATMPPSRADELQDAVLAAVQSARDGVRCLALGVAAASGLDYCGAGTGHQLAMLRKIVQRQYLMSDERCDLCCASLLATAPQPPDRAMLRDLLRALAESAASLTDRQFGRTSQGVFEGLQCAGLARAQRRLDEATRRVLFEDLLELAPACEPAVRARMLRRAFAALNAQPAGAQCVAGASQDDRHALWDAMAARAGDPQLSAGLVQEMAQVWVDAGEPALMDHATAVALGSAVGACAARMDALQAAALADGLTRQLHEGLAGPDGLDEAGGALIGDVFRVLASASGLTPAQRGAMARGMAHASAGEPALEAALGDAVAASGVPPRHLAAMVLGDCAARAARGDSTEERQAFWAEVQLSDDGECELAVELGGDPLYMLGSSLYGEQEQLELTLLACTITGPWTAQVLNRRIGQVVNMLIPESLRMEAMLRFAHEARTHLGAPLFSVMRGLAIEQVRLIRAASESARMTPLALQRSLDRALRQFERLIALCPRILPAPALRREIAAIQRAQALPAATRASLVQPLQDALKQLGDDKAG